MIKKVLIVNTESCNMRCKYCFEQLGNYPKNFIHNSTVEKFLNMLFKQDETFTGEYIIEFFGGEPMLNSKAILTGLNVIEENLRGNFKGTVLFHITSNFYYIDKEVFDKLEEMNKYTNFESKITISILLDKKLHDLDRVDINGNGTFEKVYKNMEYVINKYPSNIYATNMVISKKIIKYFSKIVDNTLEFHKKYPFVSNELVLTSTLSVEEQDEYTKEELRYIFEDYINRDKSELCDRTITALYNSIPFSFDFIRKREMSFCKIFLEEITILPNGNIIPCHRSDLGVLKKNNVDVIYGNIDNIKTFKELNLKPDIDDINNLINDNGITLYTEDGYKCNDCSFNSFCHYCPISNYNKTGFLTKRSRKECERTMTLVELTLEYERLKVMKEITNRLEKLENKMDILGELNITLLEKLVGDKDNEDTQKSIE